MSLEYTHKHASGQDVLLEVLELVNRVGQGRIFAFGETCTCAIHYQGFYENLPLEFAALREDYEELLPALQEAAAQAGLDFAGTHELGGVSL